MRIYCTLYIVCYFCFMTVVKNISLKKEKRIEYNVFIKMKGDILWIGIQ